jgi:hypothetical protein
MGLIRLARQLDARVSTNESAWLNDYPTGVARHVIGGAVAWEAAAEAYFNHLLDWRAAEFLTGLGWDAVLAERLAARWTPTGFDRARHLMRPRAKHTEVQIRPGLTVAVTPTGWVHAETGKTLLDAVPVVTAVTRDGAAVRTTGLVAYRMDQFSFSTKRFRRDPLAVVERVLVTNGQPPPTAHPMIVPHVAALALYLHKTGGG